MTLKPIKKYLNLVLKNASNALGLALITIALGLNLFFTITTFAQAPGNNTPEDPSQTSVGLPPPNRSSANSTSSATTNSSSISQNVNNQASTNQVPVVPQNFNQPDTTVRSGGFETTVIYLILIVGLVSVGYYYKNNQKTQLKTSEKRIGK